MHRRAFTMAGISAAALAVGQVASGQDTKRPAANAGHANHNMQGYAEHFQKCAEACSDCQRECDRCAMHCAGMMAQGKEHHQMTMQTCLDCADVCAAAAQIVSRGGPFSADICAACADVCKKCAAACRKHENDEMMAACAKECEACEKACRSMLQNAKPAPAREDTR